MYNRKVLKILFLMIGISFLIPKTFAQGGQIVDEIIVKVDNYIILKSEFDVNYQQFLIEADVDSDDVEAYCYVLENLVINKVMLAKAEIDSIVVEESVIEGQLNRRMEILAAQANGQENLERYYNKTIDMLKDELREPIREQLTIQRMQDEITKDIEVTPREVKEFYKRNLKDTIIIVPDEVEVAHIVKVATINEKQKEATKQKLEGIRRDILSEAQQAPSDSVVFVQYANKYSEDKNSIKEGRGGYLGWTPRGIFAPEFEAAVYRMKPGDISEIVETQFGFHIIKLHDRRGNEFESSHILLRPTTGEADIKISEDFLDSIRTLVLNDSLSFEKAAKEFSEDERTSSNGGYLGNYGGNRVPMNDLESPVFFAIEDMEEGGISEPLPYRTNEGKQAVRIIYYKKKHKGHTMSLEKDYDKIYNMALNQKQSKIIFEWFQEAKQEVFISIDEDYRHCPSLLGSQ